MKKSGVKKSISMSRRAVSITTISSLIMTLACLLVASVFFERISIGIYEQMETSITGSALQNADQELLAKIILETDEAIDRIADPATQYQSDEQKYLQNFSDIQNSADYKALWNYFNTTRKSTESTCFVLVMLRPRENYWVYVMDASDYNVIPCGTLLLDDFSQYDGHPGKEFEGFVTFSPTYGRVRTDGVPAYIDEEKDIYAYLLADIPISEVRQKGYLFILNTALLAIIITALSCIFVYLAVKKTAVEPINNIAEKAEDFVDSYEKRYGEHLETHIFEELYNGNVSELQNLSRSLSSMELETNSYIKDIDRLAGEKARTNTELEIATRIQAASIPRNFDDYKHINELELYGDMKPAKAVGGDFYDFFLLDDTHMCVVMADVSGKGIPGALYMMVSMVAIRTRAEQGGNPSEILRYVNEKLSANNSVDMFVTVWLGILDINTGHVIAANAGHEYPAVADENGTYTLMKDKHGFVCGGMEGVRYKDYEFDIPRNGRLFIYTDGVPESANNNNEFFGTDRMLSALNQCSDKNPKQTIEHVQEEIEKFTEGVERFDDTTLLCLWYKG